MPCDMISGFMFTAEGNCQYSHHFSISLDNLSEVQFGNFVRQKGA